MFDFPKVQIVVLILVAIILAYVFVDLNWIYKLPLLLMLTVDLVYQLQFVVPYTPLCKTEAKDSHKHTRENSFTLLVSNVRMANEDKARFNALVRKYNPDILLINEPDQKWAASISRLDVDFPYAIKYPQDNTYGMMLLSKLPLTESSVNFLVKDDVPSIFTKITLPSGSMIDFYGVHLKPPQPGTDTAERKSELHILSKKIRETKNPTLVAGDLNDVGWSVNLKQFRKYSEMVDPRQGRGFYNTYNVFLPLFRYPLDHIFYSREFGLVRLEKLESIGSDHFPMLISLHYEADGDYTEGLEKLNEDENYRNLSSTI